MAASYCGHCGDAATQRCKQCQVMHYCSKECQVADWKWHKLLCKQFASFVEKPNTAQEVRRVILIPEKGVEPVFYWMPMDVEEGDEYDGENEDDIEFASDIGVPDHDATSGSIMPADDDECGMGSDMPQYISLVVGKMGNGQLLDHSIKMMCKDDFTEYPPNACLARLLGSQIAYRFRGPLIFLRMTKVEDSCFTLDIDLSDFTLALDGLAAFAKKQADPLAYFANGGPGPKKVSAVQVNMHIPYYEETKVLRSHEIFTTEGSLSLFSMKLGCPVITSRFWEVDAATSTVPSIDDRGLPLLAYLRIDIDETSSTFGAVSPEIKDSLSTALVVHADMTPISISTVVALCEFIKDVAQPQLRKAASLGTKERRAVVDAVVQQWEDRADETDGGSGDENASEDEDEEGGVYDAGDFDDLADVRAKMGQMQMTTRDARTGMGFI